MLDPLVFDAAMNEIATRSKKLIYQRDYLAWANDILGRRYYAKMAGIMVECAMPSNGIIRNAIKSANGCGKSITVADLIVWWVTAFPPEESLALVSANGRAQIQTVIFKYLKDAWGYRATQHKAGNGPAPVGWISEMLEWNYTKPDGSGKEALVIGKRPADKDIVSVFQGTRKYRTIVGLDEMGGMPDDLLTASEAVTTAEESRIVGIGNPDRRGTMFFNIFNTALGADWNKHTISAYDLPTLTGEIVYDDPVKQKNMLKGLTSLKWVAHKERAWMTGGEIVPDKDHPDDEQYNRRIGGTPNGRFKAKVQGEFPGDADNTFFAEEEITCSIEKEIIPGEHVRPIIGVDIATTGEDESVVYVNRGGHLRVFDKTISYMDGDEKRETTGIWTKEDTLTAARRIHAIANYLQAAEVRVDGTAVGEGVTTDLMRLDEFKDKKYGPVISIKGARRSTDLSRWRNWRDEIHDHFNTLMKDGLVDLDPEDTQLRDELMLITYTLVSGAVKIDKKADMKTLLGGSPDRADAAMYASLDSTPLTEGLLNEMEPGDVALVDPLDVLDWDREDPTYPM